MARKPITRCNTCGQLTRSVCCRKTYRRPSRCRLYSSSRWQSVRQEQLTVQPLCSDCGGVGNHVHHCERHHCDEEKFWSSPLLTLCHRSSQKSARRLSRTGKVRRTRRSLRLRALSHANEIDICRMGSKRPSVSTDGTPGGRFEACRYAAVSFSASPGLGCVFK